MAVTKGKFRARTKHQGISYFIGEFPSKEEAERARIEFRLRRGWPMTPKEGSDLAAQTTRRLKELGLLQLKDKRWRS